MEALYQYLHNISHNRKRLHFLLGAMLLVLLLLAVLMRVQPMAGMLDAWGLHDAARSLFVALLLLSVFVVSVDYRNRTHSVSKTSLGRSELLEKYADQGGFISFGVLPLRSVIWHRYEHPPELASLSLRVEERMFRIPWYLQLHCRELIAPFNPARVFNGKTLRFEGFVDDDPACLRFSYATYFDYLISNGSHNQKLFNELTVRDLLEPGPKLSPLAVATCANHLGLSVVVRASDGHLLVQRRSKSTVVFSGQLSPSISGAANVDTFEDAGGRLSFMRWFATELGEELSGRLTPEDFTSLRVLGLSRELVRLGKPEMFIFAQARHSRTELDRILLAQERPDINVDGALFSSNRQSPHRINRSETDRFFWLDLNGARSLFDALDRDYKLSDSDDGTLSMEIDGGRYRISESLAVHLALLEQAWPELI